MRICCTVTVQKMKCSIKDFFSKCDQIRRKLRIWSNLLKKSLIENFILCVVCNVNNRLMAPTNCWKISRLWQEEVMLHAKNPYTNLTQNYLMNAISSALLVWSRNIVHFHAKAFSKPVFPWTWKIFILINYETLSNIQAGVFCKTS